MSVVKEQIQVAREASPSARGQGGRAVGTRIVGVIGSRSLPSSQSGLVGSVVEDLLRRGCHIASGGAIGADEYCLSQLVHLGESSKGTLYSPWCTYEGFPVNVRALTRQFKQYGGSVIWGSLQGKEEYSIVRTGLLQRNMRLIEAVSGIVAFLHGESKGSLFTIRKALAGQLQVVIFCLDCTLPEFPNIKWKPLLCGGCWEGAYKAVYLK